MTSDRSNNGPKGRDAIQEIARRLGSIVDAVEGAIQNGGSEGGRDFSIDTPLGPLTGRYGMTVKSGISRPRSAQREPMFDTFDEPDEIVVTADIPGLEFADVSANCEAGHLVLAIGGMTALARRFAFPALTPEHHPRIRVANGILEIRIRKALRPDAAT
jgi:hypothetical protein